MIRNSTNVSEVANDVIDELVAEWAIEKPELNAQPMLVIGRILRIASLLQAEISRTLKPYGLHYTDFDILASLRRKGSPFELSPSQLSAAVILTSGAMTAALGRLEKSSLVKRVKDKSDGRGRKVRLTKKGERLIEKIVAVRFGVAEANVAGLSAKDRNTLACLLKDMLQGIEV